MNTSSAPTSGSLTLRLVWQHNQFWISPFWVWRCFDQVLFQAHPLPIRGVNPLYRPHTELWVWSTPITRTVLKFFKGWVWQEKTKSSLLQPVFVGDILVKTSQQFQPTFHATSNLPSPGSKRDNDRECIARTANPKLWSSLPITTTGPNNNVKLFLPKVSSRIFLFLLFPCLFPSVISISGQYRYFPPKIEVLITANKLRNPFLSSFLANTTI